MDRVFGVLEIYMNIEILSAKFTGSGKRQFLSFVNINGDGPFPFYVSLENSDSSEVYKYIRGKYDTGELIPDDPDIDLDQVATDVRFERNRRLNDTDYLMQPDYPISEETRTALKAYRQALRDITSQEGFPQEVVWPEKPSV